MRKFNILFLLVWCLFVIACSESAEVTPELQSPTGDSPCLEGGFGDCDDSPPPPPPPPPPPGGGSAIFKFYAKGLSSYTVNQGTSSNGTSWTGQGSSGVTEIAPSAVYFQNQIFAYRATRENGFDPLHPHPRMKVSISTDNGASWAQHDLGGTPIETRVAQSVVEFDGFVWMAVKAIDPIDNIMIYRSPDGLNNWQFHSIAMTSSENQSRGEPYLAAHNSSLYIFGVDPNSNPFYKRLVSTNGTIWTNPTNITGHISGSPVVAKGGITAVSHNNQLWAVYRTFSNNMVAVNALSRAPRTGHYVTTAKTSLRPSMVSDGSKMVLIYKGNSSPNIFYATSTNGSTWNGNTWAVGQTNDGPYVICY